MEENLGAAAAMIWGVAGGEVPAMTRPAAPPRNPLNEAPRLVSPHFRAWVPMDFVFVPAVATHAMGM
jgi:hypothetical protein